VLVTSKLNERTTNVYENKGSLPKTAGLSGNVCENKALICKNGNIIENKRLIPYIASSSAVQQGCVCPLPSAVPNPLAALTPKSPPPGHSRAKLALSLPKGGNPALTM
jgi:hypothetical protein